MRMLRRFLLLVFHAPLRLRLVWFWPMLVMAIGVVVSLLVFMLIRDEARLSAVRQAERPVVKELSSLQGQIDNAAAMLNAGAQFLWTAPNLSLAQLAGFMRNLGQGQTTPASIYQITFLTPTRAVLSPLVGAAVLPLGTQIDLEADQVMAGLFLRSGHAGVTQSALWPVGSELGQQYVLLAQGCGDGCALLAALPLAQSVTRLQQLVGSGHIAGFNVTETMLLRDSRVNTVPRLYRFGVDLESSYMRLGEMLSAETLLFKDRVWQVNFLTNTGGLRSPASLPYLILAAGLLLSFALAIYIGTTMRHSAVMAKKIAAEARLIDALSASETKYRNIFENAGVGMAQVTRRGEWFSANKILAQTLGYDDPQTLMAAQPDLKGQLFVEPSARERFFTSLAREPAHDVETTMRRRDGAIIWVSLGGHLMVTPEVPDGYYECTLQDVTARRMTEMALIAAKEQADFANRSKSEFLANMSHELRTPLNAIIGFSEIIKDQLFGPVGTAQYVEYAKDIHDSGGLLLSLINDILDMSKIEAGARKLTEGAVDVEQMIQSCVRLVAARAKTQKLRLQLDVPRDLPQLRAEERALKQVLTNLLSNAVKFTPEGGTVSVDVWVDPQKYLSIAVRDTGIGMSAEEIPIALAPFGQIESALSRSHQGTGLGLPLTKALVELHGGRLLVESTPGQGTTVIVRMPPERLMAPRPAVFTDLPSKLPV